MAAVLNDFAAALRDLNGAGIRYVVVGGLAVIRHGAVRATRRIDGVEAAICSLADLVAMKRATGRGVDELDLERLREAHGRLPGDA